MITALAFASIVFALLCLLGIAASFTTGGPTFTWGGSLPWHELSFAGFEFRETGSPTSPRAQLTIPAWLLSAVCALLVLLCVRHLRRALAARDRDPDCDPTWGLCPKCGYPLGESSVCTECGVELAMRAASELGRPAELADPRTGTLPIDGASRFF